MKTTDTIKAIGKLRLVLTGPDGRVKEDVELDNLVVTTGLGFMASRLVSGATATMSHMALGQGAVAPALGNTTLGNELGRVALASANAAGAVVTYTATFNPGVATGAVTEAGILNAGAAGTLLNRVVFPVVNKAAGDTLAVSWTVTLA